MKIVLYTLQNLRLQSMGYFGSATFLNSHIRESNVILTLENQKNYHLFEGGKMI